MIQREWKEKPSHAHRSLAYAVIEAFPEEHDFDRGVSRIINDWREKDSVSFVRQKAPRGTSIPSTTSTPFAMQYTKLRSTISLANHSETGTARSPTSTRARLTMIDE
jgi:hypothetical protein